MKCEDCQIIIEDYVDGLLVERAAESVGAHLRECPNCAEFHNLFIREQAIYARYQRDIDVTPELWAAVEARINGEQIATDGPGLLARLRQSFAAIFHAPRLSPALAAALVVIAIGVTVGVMSYLSSRKPAPESATAQKTADQTISTGSDEKRSTQQDPNTPSNPGGVVAAVAVPATRGSVPRRNAPSTAHPTAAQLIREAEQKYVAAIAILSRDMDRRRPKLDPLVVAQFDAALANIDSTIRETRRVVRQNPGDPAALQYLLAAYSKKVDALREMSRD